MNARRTCVSAILSAGAAALIRSFYEVRHIKLTEYRISSEKIPSDSKIKIVFISDLHARNYGKDNADLINLIKKAQPDVILIGGDLITASGANGDKKMFALLKRLREICPVYMAMGNHEEYLRTEKYDYGQRFDELEQMLCRLDIPLLKNGHIDICRNISVYGLEISRKYYARFNRKAPKKKDMFSYLGVPDKNRYNILLAHTPAFFDVYETWKPDLVLSGHYHGGIIGLPSLKEKEKRRGLISPGFKIFPDYCAGKFKKNNTDLIVSAGCGTHGINLRLFNKPEVLSIELSSET